MRVYEAALQEAFRITEEMPNVHDRAEVLCIALPVGDPSTEMLQRLATNASFPLVAFSRCEREGLLAPALGLGAEPVNLLRIVSVKWLSKDNAEVDMILGQGHGRVSVRKTRGAWRGTCCIGGVIGEHSRSPQNNAFEADKPHLAA